jgi:hypothetical protein
MVYRFHSCARASFTLRNNFNSVDIIYNHLINKLWIGYCKKTKIFISHIVNTLCVWCPVIFQMHVHAELVHLAPQAC